MADRKVFANQGPTDPELKKSGFDKSFSNNLTARFGRLYPVFVEEAMAGSSYKIKPSFAFDMVPLVFPIQTNVRAHMSFYKIPFRILWKHYRDFFSQVGSDGQINGNHSYVMPYIKRQNWVTQGSLADYMGLPTSYVDTIETSSRNSNQLSNPGVVIYEDGVVNYYKSNGQLVYNFPSGVSTTHSFGFPVSFRKGIRFGTHAGNGVATPFTFRFSYVVDASRVTETAGHFNLRSDLIPAEGSRPKLTIGFGAGALNQFSTRVDPNGQSSVQFNLRTILSKEGSFTEVFPLSNDATGDSAMYLGFVDFALTVSELAALNGIAANNAITLLFRYGFSSPQRDAYNLIWLNPNYNYNNGTHVVVGLEQVSRDGEESLGSTNKANITGSFDTPSMPTLYSICDYWNDLYVNKQSRRYFDAIPGTNDGEPYLPINALPFRAYEFIYRYFFENSRVSPFIKDGKPCYNEFLTNDGDGADESTPLDFFHAPYEYDMFTTCVKEPFFGNAPLVGVSMNDDTQEATFNFVNPDSHEEYSAQIATNSAGQLTGITMVNGNAKESTINALNQAIQLGISIADFRNVNALTRFQERHMKAGTKYQNLVFEFFGTNPPIGEEFPEYIGGLTRSISVQKIVNTAQNDSVDAHLGDFAGMATFRGAAEKGDDYIECFCSEPSYIMGILYFTVTPVYSQMLPTHFLKSKLLDYANPLFANISPQPVMKRNLAPLQLTISQLNDVFGYNRPYADYCSRQDEVHGEFRGTMANFLLQRLFGAAPSLNKSFVEIDSNDLTDIFADTDDTDKLYGQITFDVDCRQPLPRYSIPQII